MNCILLWNWTVAFWHWKEHILPSTPACIRRQRTRLVPISLEFTNSCLCLILSQEVATNKHFLLCCTKIDLKWFCSMHCLFGKYYLTELCRSSQCWQTSLYDIRTTFINVTQTHFKNLQVLGSCPAHSGKYRFSNILMFTGKLKCYH